MTFRPSRRSLRLSVLITALAAVLASESAASGDLDGLLKVLLENGSITQEQYELLVNRGPNTTQQAEEAADSTPLPRGDAAAGTTVLQSSDDAAALPSVDAGGDDAANGGEKQGLDPWIREQIAAAVSAALSENLPVKASYGSKGFRLETQDGNWQTNLQWRAQIRLTYPTAGDPRQVDSFRGRNKLSFENRRLRMKIGGHGYRPWLKYYFEVDLQPSRDTDDSSSNASARVIDWRIDVAKWKKIALRVGQWKIDHNRERVDSSGRQQFVERSIVNRIFTIDRQVGVQLKGHLFDGTHADMRYYAGVYTGEGRGVLNDDSNLMYAGRLQWNFLGRDLAWRQTDVERTELPTGNLAIGAAHHTGRCTRWSSSGCGNLDGFADTGDDDDDARRGQFEITQAVQEFAFKWQGFSVQQEFHWKRVTDRVNVTESDLYGLYAQTGYFFHELCEVVPEPLEVAFRYAWVREPNEEMIGINNNRQEFTGGLNWFFAGHNNKLTFDYSYLTLADNYLRADVGDHRFRLQWDVSF